MGFFFAAPRKRGRPGPRPGTPSVKTPKDSRQPTKKNESGVWTHAYRERGVDGVTKHSRKTEKNKKKKSNHHVTSLSTSTGSAASTAAASAAVAADTPSTTGPWSVDEAAE